MLRLMSHLHAASLGVVYYPCKRVLTRSNGCHAASDTCGLPESRLRKRMRGSRIREVHAGLWLSYACGLSYTRGDG